MIKQENEITVMLHMTMQEAVQYLEAAGFRTEREFLIHDRYFLPENCDRTRSTLEILNDAVLVRDFGDICTLTYKHKEYDRDGNILSQSSTAVAVSGAKEAGAFLEAIGYRFAFSVRDQARVMLGSGPGFVLENINDGQYLMLEIEENEQYRGIDQLIRKLDESGIPYDRSTYFCKKAQLVYDGIYGTEYT